MSTNYFNGLCNADNCTHQCCWNYYRKLIKNQVSPCFVEERKQRQIEIPHQSIHNISTDLLLNTSSNNVHLDLHRSQESKNNPLMDYLISRKKSSNPYMSSKTAGTYFRDSTNFNRTFNKVSTLDVHEVFELEELQSDWRKTFQAKDYYVWMPGNKEIKKVKDDTKKMRIIKTPVLQLAPVADSRINSSLNTVRKDPSFISFGTDGINQKTLGTRMRTLPRCTTRIDPLNDDLISRINETKNVKENIRQKLLEATLNQAKMQIHSLDSKQFSRYDFVNTNQVYLLDDNFYQNISRQSKLLPVSPNASETGGSKLPLPNKVHFKGVSIIESAPSENDTILKLEPQQSRLSLIKSAISTRKEDCTSLLDDKSSLCDSMVTNAYSDRSTLNDEDILPGSNMLQMLQTSYKLMQERSDNLTSKNNHISDNIKTYDQEVQLHKVNVSYSRKSKSAFDKKIIQIETPDPPPPSPDITERFRSTSAATARTNNEEG